MVPSKLHSIFR